MTRSKQILIVLWKVLTILVLFVIGIHGTSHIADIKRLTKANELYRCITLGKMHNLVIALKSYNLDCGIYPSEDKGIVSLFYDTNTKWKGPYLSEITTAVDAWGREISYKVRGGQIFVISFGQDGRLGTADDIIESIHPEK